MLFIYESTTDPTPTPPHPSTLKPLPIRRPTRTRFPFSQIYVSNSEKVTSVLLNKIIGPLEDLGVVSETTTPGTNLWQGWVRVPKKGESWELKNERINGVQKLDGDFHRVNLAYVPSSESALGIQPLILSLSRSCRYIPKRSRGSALLALTGDDDYWYYCKQKAIQVGLYLNEWGLWEWEPDSQSLARFQSSDAPHKKTSLGAMWGSETEADEGRWILLESTEEEQILNTIGVEYAPPDKRNFRFIVAPARPKKGPVSMMNP